MCSHGWIQEFRKWVQDMPPLPWGRLPPSPPPRLQADGARDFLESLKQVRLPFTTLITPCCLVVYLPSHCPLTLSIMGCLGAAFGCKKRGSLHCQFCLRLTWYWGRPRASPAGGFYKWKCGSLAEDSGSRGGSPIQSLPEDYIQGIGREQENLEAHCC